ncbi:MAG: substrate-binding domain-containing protein, partial [Bacteroides sp.]|nr:substrate-binding domain-containing protein [Bacteroides sp.]
LNSEMVREASFYPGMEVEIRTVKDDTRRQIADVQSFIDRKVDLLVVSPNESAALTPSIEKACQAGIPVILIDRKIDSEAYTTYVGGDNYQLAYELGLYAAGVLRGKGEVVVMRGFEGSTADTERYQGFMEALSAYPDIKIVAEARVDFLKEEARKQMEKILETIRKVDLVFAMNDPMALGVHEATIRYSGQRPFIIGIDALYGPSGGIESIKKGLIDASFIYPTGGDKVIALAYQILTGEPYHKENILPTAAVDQTNARVLQLQTSQIVESQLKIDRINQLLDTSLVRYANQRTLFYSSLLALALLIAVLLFAARAYRLKSKANRQLARQNEEIKRQAERLKEQKEQLELLSAQLKEAIHAKLVFFTNISHEFKTPLSLILGPVDSLMAGKNLTDKQHEMLSLIKRNSNRLLFLISEIIEFRSYENGKMNVNFTRNPLIPFLEELTRLFEEYKHRKNMELSFETDGSDLELWFDKEKLEKIYSNLLSNAFRYVNESGKIKVTITTRTHEDEEYAVISVSNTGSYIPGMEQQNIFQRFYKVEDTKEGIGIGLALTQTLVEVHRGRIEVESSKKEGTTFHVFLHFIQEESTRPDTRDLSGQGEYTKQRLELERETQPDKMLSGSKEKKNKHIILVVEDNTDIRNFITSSLEDNYIILKTHNGMEGVEKAKKYIPDLVISDVMMPLKDGYELCGELKNHMPTSHIPVVLLTACSLDEQKNDRFREWSRCLCTQAL